MRTFAYARISVDHDNSISIEDQAAKISAYAALHDINVSAEGLYIDRSESGRSLDRPQLTALLSAARPGDTIIVAKLDRLTRNLGDLNDLVAVRGLNIVSVAESFDSSSATGRLLMNILGTFAQFERETIVERTTASLTFKRKSGKVYGPVPFGYARVGDELAEYTPEQESLELMRLLRANDESYRTIAKELNLRGYRSRAKSGTWTPGNVYAVLHSLKETE